MTLTDELYLTDRYLDLNPTLHEEDNPWKVNKILPLIINHDYLLQTKTSLLDVGGGTGLILRQVTEFLEGTYAVKVTKHAVDLSPKALQLQQENNPGLEHVFNEDICVTSLMNKEICLALMIDVLEHIELPFLALSELGRVSEYVILKVPLEDNLLLNAINFLTRGAKRKRDRETIGHVSYFNMTRLVAMVEKYCGQVLEKRYANVFSYFQSSPYYKKRLGYVNKAKNFLGAVAYRVSPRLSSFLFTDHAILLVKCRETQ